MVALNTKFIDMKIRSALCDLTLGQIRLKSADGKYILILKNNMKNLRMFYMNY
jgi:hypothetical protein